MKRLELYFIRTILITALAAIALSPFFAVSHFVYGVTHGTLDTSHLIALCYLLLIGFCFFMISPVFSENKH
ncbi:MAG TPA: hypothetical protein VE079_06250 [Ensifer sp.]|nr:hypothetical protein [Ensifer sp.]